MKTKITDIELPKSYNKKPVVDTEQYTRTLNYDLLLKIKQFELPLIKISALKDLKNENDAQKINFSQIA